ncbi:hypothetical protein ACH4UR_25140 [Streptomyces lydicus]|uniref:hypothetical protein n=1 Tax=Streptomyces lydicus TaxID=47763 RepID=UPI003791C7CE
MLHVRCRPDTSEDAYRQVFDMLTGYSPVGQALPSAAALVEARGALPYFGCSSDQLAARIRLRAMALVGVDVHVGVASSWAVAAMASARPARNGIRLVVPDGEPAFLDQLPIEALHGIGPVQATRLRTFGLETIGALAATRP